MKILKYFLLSLFLVLFTNMPTQAASIDTAQTEIEYLENGDYIETTLVILPSIARSSTCKGSKTTTYKNSSGSTMWSITVSASFSYAKGKSSKCISASGSASSNSKRWKVSTPDTSKSANKATTTATGTLYRNSKALKSITRSVTLTCDTYGNLS